MSISQGGYLPSLTAMRGIAAIWVMLFHIDVSLFYRDLGPIIPHDWTGLITSGYLLVDFFFVLSGFIIAHAYGARFAAGFSLPVIRDYLSHRFFRIYPLHLFTLVLLIVFSAGVRYFQPGVIDDSLESYFSASALPSNLLLTNAMNQYVYLSWNIVSWSIGAEWWTYFAGILLLVGLARARAAEVMLLLGMGLIVLLVDLHPNHNLDITFDYGFFRCLFEFTMGVGLYQLYQRGTASNILSRDSMMALLVLTLVAKFHFGWSDLMAPPLFALMVLAAAHNKAGFGRLMAARVPQYLGRISYSIYLMHGVWFMVFWSYLPMLKENLGDGWSPMMRLAYVALFIGLSIGSAAISYRFIEVPGRTLLRKRRAAPATPSYAKGEETV